jgi:hypothetical protein
MFVAIFFSEFIHLHAYKIIISHFLETHASYRYDNTDC